jgi:hypothetical protein
LLKPLGIWNEVRLYLERWHDGAAKAGGGSFRTSTVEWSGVDWGGGSVRLA